MNFYDDFTIELPVNSAYCNKRFYCSMTKKSEDGAVKILKEKPTPYFDFYKAEGTTFILTKMGGASNFGKDFFHKIMNNLDEFYKEEGEISNRKVLLQNDNIAVIRVHVTQTTETMEDDPFIETTGNLFIKRVVKQTLDVYQIFIITERNIYMFMGNNYGRGIFKIDDFFWDNIFCTIREFPSKEDDYEEAIRLYNSALKNLSESYLNKAEALFRKLGEYKDAPTYLSMCRDAADTIKKKLTEKNYQEACQKFKTSKTSEDFRETSANFKDLGTYKDSEEYKKKCDEEATRLKAEETEDNYQSALNNMSLNTKYGYQTAKKLLSSIINYKNSSELYKQCTEKIAEFEKVEAEQKARELRIHNYHTAVYKMSLGSKAAYQEAKKIFDWYPGYENSNELSRQCAVKIAEFEKAETINRLKKEISGWQNEINATKQNFSRPYERTVEWWGFFIFCFIISGMICIFCLREYPVFALFEGIIAGANIAMLALSISKQRSKNEPLRKHIRELKQKIAENREKLNLYENE